MMSVTSPSDKVKSRAPAKVIRSRIVNASLMAGNAIGRLRYHLIDTTCLDSERHRLARPGILIDTCGTAYRVIGEDLDDRPALALATLAAQSDLILNRASVLQGT